MSAAKLSERLRHALYFKKGAASITFARPALNPLEKREHVSVMAHSSWGLKTTQEEVAKCRVPCADHHRRHTIRQFGYKKWLVED